MLHLWNGRGDTMDIRLSAFILRATYNGWSGTPGVAMYLIDGATWFLKTDEPIS